MVTEAPVAVIGFSQSRSPLEPAWPSTHRAMLPVAGKALIVHLLEQLSAGGIRHVRLAGGIQQVAVRKRLGSGLEWGLRIRYSDLRGDDLRLQTLAEFGQCIELSGDQLHLFDAARLNSSEAYLPTELRSDPGAAHWRSGPDSVSVSALESRAAGDYRFEPLTNVADYHRVNLAAVAGEFPTLVIPGRTSRDGLTTDWKARIARSATLGQRVFVGKQCCIGKRAQLQGDCVLANGAVVGAGTRLRNVSVLPNCYIGPNTRLKDAVIGPRGVFDLQGRHWPVNNTAVLDRWRTANSPVTGLPGDLEQCF